jgi:hypothetical protein
MKTFFFLIIASFLYADEFKSKPIVSLQGQNNEYEFVSSWNDEKNLEELYICFTNTNSNIYSILLKQVEPFDTSLIVISSDSIPKQNPSISKNSSSSIRIVWQELINSKWQLFSRIFTPDSVSEIKQLTNTFENNTYPQLDWNSIIWISGQDLMYAEISDSLHSISKIDSGQCSIPDWMGIYCSVIYQKKINENNALIKCAWYNYSEKKWYSEILTKDGYATNPRYTFGEESFTFQILDTVWYSYLSIWENDSLHTLWSSNNANYNIENPYYFSYPTITKNTNEIRDWFVVYESDSIINNKEIILEFVPDNGQKKINISNLSGDDINPLTLQINDSVAVVWEHINGESSQIYWAKEKFRPYTNIDEERIFTSTNFTLSQNYPNPFNPRTTIEYFIPYSTKISINIYNILGKRIRTVISEKFQVGNMEIVWDGKNDNDNIVSSGIYYYVLEYGSQKLSRKMVLIR